MVSTAFRKQRTRKKIAIKIFRFWLPVIIWAGFIFYVSNVPNLQSGLPYDFILRKAAHVTEYFVLAFLLYRALKNTCYLKGFCLPFFLGVLGLAYAITDEVHQVFIAGRHGAPRDVLIDMVGIIGFYVVAKIYQNSSSANLQTVR